MCMRLVAVLMWCCYSLCNRHCAMPEMCPQLRAACLQATDAAMLAVPQLINSRHCVKVPSMPAVELLQLSLRNQAKRGSPRRCGAMCCLLKGAALRLPSIPWCHVV